MDSFMTEFTKALGGKGGDLWKRFSAAHRGGITKIAGHVGKAMAFHKSAHISHLASVKAAGDSMESCAKALEHIHKAHEMHKEFCKKAVGAGESTQMPHNEIDGHLEAAKGMMTKAIGEHMKAMMHAHKAVHQAHLDTHDQHDLAKGAISKVAASWVGEASETPAAAGPGYDPSQAGHASTMSQSTVSEGDVPEYDPFAPYDGKALRVVPNGGGQVTEAEAKIREENAALKAKLEATEKALETIGNMPGPVPGARVFAGNKGGAGPEITKGSVDQVLTELLAAGQISKFELENFAKDPEVRQRVTMKVIGWQASAHERGDGSYAKTIMDPGFRGNGDMITKRTVAGTASPSAGVINPNFAPARPNGGSVFDLGK